MFTTDDVVGYEALLYTYHFHVCPSSSVYLPFLPLSLCPHPSAPLLSPSLLLLFLLLSLRLFLRSSHMSVSMSLFLFLLSSLVLLLRPSLCPSACSFVSSFVLPICPSLPFFLSLLSSLVHPSRPYPSACSSVSSYVLPNCTSLCPSSYSFVLLFVHPFVFVSLSLFICLSVRPQRFGLSGSEASLQLLRQGISASAGDAASC